jgi:hypothetical protein
MTRLLTTTLVLGASLAAALVGAAPSFAAQATPKPVAVRPSGRLVAPEIVITAVREQPQGAPVINVSATREKDDKVLAANDERPAKS